jgi:hypothetical protein
MGGRDGGGGFNDTQNLNPRSFRSRPRVGIKFIDPMNDTRTEDPYNTKYHDPPHTKRSGQAKLPNLGAG